MLQFLKVRKGEAPSVADSSSFKAITTELSAPLMATLLTREAVLNPEFGIPADRVPGSRDRPEDWGAMHEWETFGAGFSKNPETTAIRFALYYPHPEWAELDAGTLMERIESYLPALESFSVLHQFCESWSPLARVHGNGSTLTVKCEVPTGEESRHLRGGVTSLVPLRLLGFLAP